MVHWVAPGTIGKNLSQKVTYRGRHNWARGFQRSGHRARPARSRGISDMNCSSPSLAQCLAVAVHWLLGGGRGLPRRGRRDWVGGLMQMQRLKEGERSGGSESGERRCDVVDWLNGVDWWTGGWVDGWPDGRGFVLRFKSRRLFLSFMVEFGSVQAQPASSRSGGGGRWGQIGIRACVYLDVYV